MIFKILRVAALYIFFFYNKGKRYIEKIVQ